MKTVPPSIQRLINEFNKLPGIGSKTSERFVYHLLRRSSADIVQLANALMHVKDDIRLCADCFTYSEKEVCDICSDPQRTRSLMCVVAEPKDMVAIEKTGQFDGVYHVLGGVINHADGIGPQELRMEELLRRVDRYSAEEVIIATNPDMEGETTALYIAKKLEGKNVRVTKIARGLPIGADIEFADEVTLSSALDGRQELNLKRE